MDSYSQGDVERAARVASALDSPLRLRILLLLSTGEHVVHELVSSLEKSQPLISQHLRVLKRANLVTSARRGREVVYTITRRDVAEVITSLMHIAGTPDVIDLASRRPTSAAEDGEAPATSGAVAIIDPPSHLRPDIDPGLSPSTAKPKRD